MPAASLSLYAIFQPLFSGDSTNISAVANNVWIGISCLPDFVYFNIIKKLFYLCPFLYFPAVGLMESTFCQIAVRTCKTLAMKASICVRIKNFIYHITVQCRQIKIIGHNTVMQQRVQQFATNQMIINSKSFETLFFRCLIRTMYKCLMQNFVIVTLDIFTF